MTYSLLFTTISFKISNNAVAVAPLLQYERDLLYVFPNKNGYSLLYATSTLFTILFIPYWLTVVHVCEFF